MEYWLGVATLTGIYMIAVLGMSILTGFTGLFSVGHAGFMAIGAYTSALLTKTYGIPIVFGIIFAMAAALLVGLLIGYPTLKLKGDYFVIATLGIGQATKLIIENLTDITGGARGLTGIPEGSSFLTVLIIVLVVIWILSNFLRSKQGRNCVAVREDELAAASIGTKVASYKLLAMGISCALCGLSGALLAHYMQYLSPSMFSIVKSDELVMTVILGGTGSLTGSVIASLVLIPLPEVLRFGAIQEWRMVFYGLLVVLVIIFKPSGLMGNKEISIAGIRQIFKNIGLKLKHEKAK
ncbi:MAG: branched-chain amino acid ABC transporter permease [Clostridiaceae bacterium]|nr:branched-chain amino acid ABC transporter permease [Clostridiaceae bacterium]